MAEAMNTPPESDKKMVTEKNICPHCKGNSHVKKNQAACFITISPANRKFMHVVSVEIANKMIATERKRAVNEVLGSSEAKVLFDAICFTIQDCGGGITELDDALAAFHKKWGGNK